MQYRLLYRLLCRLTWASHVTSISSGSCQHAQAMIHINHSPVLVAHAARRLPYVSDSMKLSPRSVTPTLTTCIICIAVSAVPCGSNCCTIQQYCAHSSFIHCMVLWCNGTTELLQTGSLPVGTQVLPDTFPGGILQFVQNTGVADPAPLVVAHGWSCESHHSPGYWICVYPSIRDDWSWLTDTAAEGFLYSIDHYLNTLLAIFLKCLLGFAGLHVQLAYADTVPSSPIDIEVLRKSKRQQGVFEQNTVDCRLNVCKIDDKAYHSMICWA